jgi:hypothetical protein
MTEVFRVGYLERLPLGTPYPGIVAYVGRLLGRLPGAELVIDLTGVGRPVFDMFRFSGITPVGVLITSGAAETGGGPIHGVPKLDLVSRLQALLHEGRLKIHKDLAEADTLVRELQDFRCEFTAAGHLTFNARLGKHDDLVLALAIAVWRAADGGMSNAGLFRYYQELAGAVVPPRDVIGVDLGQSRDPTAIAIVRRVADPDVPEVAAVEIRLPQQPESTAEPPDLASPEHRDELIAATKAALRHRISSTGPFAATFGSHQPVKRLPEDVPGNT